MSTTERTVRPLPSWREGRVRDAILSFVDDVTTGPSARPHEERIAVFDNDGTLWCEKPMPAQVHYLLQQWSAAAADPATAAREPYRAAAERDTGWFQDAFERHHRGDPGAIAPIVDAVVATVDGRTVDEVQREVGAFLRSARHPVLHRLYASTVYRPMLELLRLLADHGFACYLVSGGDRDFMRAFSDELYGIPAERVIGSTVGLHYDPAANVLRYGSAFEIFDDGPAKPARIWSRLGRRPLLAAGNSDGDLPMLRYALGHEPSLALLVHHDDNTGRGDEPYDAGAEQALASASDDGIVIVSVREDWNDPFGSTT